MRIPAKTAVTSAGGFRISRYRERERQTDRQRKRECACVDGDLKWRKRPLSLHQTHAVAVVVIVVLFGSFSRPYSDAGWARAGSPPSRRRLTMLLPDPLSFTVLTPTWQCGSLLPSGMSKTPLTDCNNRPNIGSNM